MVVVVVPACLPACTICGRLEGPHKSTKKTQTSVGSKPYWRIGKTNKMCGEAPHVSWTSWRQDSRVNKKKAWDWERPEENIISRHKPGVVGPEIFFMLKHEASLLQQLIQFEANFLVYPATCGLHDSSQSYSHKKGLQVNEGLGYPQSTIGLCEGTKVKG